MAPQILKNTLTICAVIATLGLWSCQQDATIDLPYSDPLITANCLFNADSSMSLQLIRSRQPLEDEYQAVLINDGSVLLFENGAAAGSFVFDSMGFYHISHSPSAGSVYSISVTAPGYPSVNAIDTLPLPGSIISASVRDSAFSSPDMGFEAEVSVTISDPAGMNNYYLLQMRGNYWYLDEFGDTIFETYPVYFSTLDPLISELTGATFDDKTFNGGTHEFRLRVQQYSLENVTDLYLQLYTISRSCFLYTQSYYRQLNVQGNPFAEPVQVYSNIENGYGIFAGRTMREFRLR